jgi:glutamyl-tRNA synthetase
VTIVWNDPVNLMNYVSFVFQTYFGYSRKKAEKLMLEVHHDGKSVVSHGTREEMEREFSIDRIGASPSVFDPEKLLWMNAQYMARLPATEILERAKPYAPAGLPPHDAALAAVELHRTRSRTAIEMGRALSTYAADPEEYDADGLRKNVRPETALEIERLISKFEAVDSWTAHDLDAALRELAAEMKISASRLIHPTRLALTGVTVGAPLFDVVALLGKETALRRLRKFVQRIRSGSAATPGPGNPPEGGASL